MKQKAEHVRRSRHPPVRQHKKRYRGVGGSAFRHSRHKRKKNMMHAYVLTMVHRDTSSAAKRSPNRPKRAHKREPFKLL